MTRILVVEDDRDIAELVRRYLEKSAFTVEVVASGRDALTALTDRPPDLLILDLMLPHVGGTDICRAARANERTAAIPIIMLTARADESDKVTGLEGGADDYVTKPFSARELVARIMALLRRTSTGAEEGRVDCGGLSLDTAGHRVIADGRVRGDPYVALTDLAQRIVPEGYADWDYDIVSYNVERHYDYPRFLCYDCHSYVSYSYWDPYYYSCVRFRMFVYDDPWYYPDRYYGGGTRVVFVRPYRPQPRYIFKDWGTSRPSRWVPPYPGMMPSETSGCPSRALSAARRRVQAIASSSPPPRA